MKVSLILLASLVLLMPGVATADPPPDPEEWLGYCVVVDPDYFPPVTVDLDYCNVPPVPPDDPSP